MTADPTHFLAIKTELRPFTAQLLALRQRIGAPAPCVLGPFSADCFARRVAQRTAASTPRNEPFLAALGPRPVPSPEGTALAASDRPARRRERPDSSTTTRH